jgi:hypothetical protein
VSDLAGAIEDLRASAARAATDELRAERQAWVESLRLGQNPFTEAVLTRLKRRTI